MTANIKETIPCPTCNGTGTISGGPCTNCGGDGAYNTGIGLTPEWFDAITVKLDAIKTMLDSPVLGMQKMSSNLDDIMTKLDV